MAHSQIDFYLLDRSPLPNLTQVILYPLGESDPSVALLQDEMIARCRDSVCVCKLYTVVLICYHYSLNSLIIKHKKMPNNNKNSIK